MSSGNSDITNSSANGPLPNSSSFNPRVSGNGRYITFESAASNLVPGTRFIPGTDPPRRDARNPFAGDTNEEDIDVFIHDLATQTTTKVNIDANGQQCTHRIIDLVDGQLEETITGCGTANEPDVSDDGRYVVYRSDVHDMPGVDLVTNLVSGTLPPEDGPVDPPPSGAAGDIFLKDRVTGKVTRITNRLELGRGSSWNPTISGDGKFVAFQTHGQGFPSSDSGPDIEDTNQEGTSVYVWNREQNTFAIASLDSDGAGLNAGTLHQYRPAISKDGRHVAFGAFVEGTFSTVVFVRDMQQNITRSFSDSFVTGLAPGIGFDDFDIGLSDDGRWVGFESSESNRVYDDTNGAGFHDAFVAYVDPIATGMITGTLFNDQNRNGTQDANELGLPNFPVEIFKGLQEIADGIAAFVAQTDSNGNFRIEVPAEFSTTVTENYFVRPQFPSNSNLFVRTDNGSSPSGEDQPPANPNPVVPVAVTASNTASVGKIAVAKNPDLKAVSIGVEVGRTVVSRFTAQLNSLLEFQATDLAIEYTSINDELKLRGKLELSLPKKSQPEHLNVAVELLNNGPGDDNFIRIMKGNDGVEVDIVGKAVGTRLVDIPPRYKLKKVEFQLNTIERTAGGATQLELPLTPQGLAVDAAVTYFAPTMRLLDFDSFLINVRGLGIPLNAAIAFDGAGVSGKNLSSAARSAGKTIEFTGMVQFVDNFAARNVKFFIPLPNSLGGAITEAALLDIEVSGTLTSESVKGQITAKIIDRVLDAKGSVEFKFRRGVLTSSGEVKSLANIIVGNRRDTISAAGYSGVITGTIGIPASFIPFPFNLVVSSTGIRVSGGARAQVDFGDFENGFLAAWGSILDRTAGLKVKFDGTTTFLGASQVSVLTAGSGGED